MNEASRPDSCCMILRSRCRPTACDAPPSSGAVVFDVAPEHAQKGVSLRRRKSLVATDGVLGTDLGLIEGQPGGVHDELVGLDAEALGQRPEHPDGRLVQ